MKTGIFNAEIYHKEQKALREGAEKCTNCLLPGHRRFEGKNPVVCSACHRPGHRRGDTPCELTPQQTERGPVLHPPASPHEEEERESGAKSDADLTLTPVAAPAFIPSDLSPDIMPTSQNRDTAVDAASGLRKGGEKKSARKQKSKQNKKEKGKIQSVLNAFFHPRGEVSLSTRHRVQGSNSEREEEQTSKRPAAQQTAVRVAEQ